MAVSQARAAAQNIIAEIAGDSPEAEYYHEIAAIINSGDADSIQTMYFVAFCFFKLAQIKFGLSDGGIKKHLFPTLSAVDFSAIQLLGLPFGGGRTAARRNYFIR